MLQHLQENSEADSLSAMTIHRGPVAVNCCFNLCVCFFVSIIFHHSLCMQLTIQLFVCGHPSRDLMNDSNSCALEPTSCPGSTPAVYVAWERG